MGGRMISIRKEIANRLSYEIERRNLSISQASNLINISDEIIKGYLSEKREIKFSEIINICNGFGINPVRFIYSEKYPKPKLAFRNVGFNIQRFASEIEDVFLLIEDYLPFINTPKMTRINNKSYNRDDIISEAATFASNIQSKYGTPENFISTFSIPVFPIKCNHVEFDAFIINHNKHAAICINISKPPHRIRFSLAHEIAHLLFDLGNEVPIDVFLPNLYRKSRIDKNEVPEFFAYKFAQFFLIPYDETYNIALKYPRLDINRCQKSLDKFHVSKDVLSNALFDVISSNKDSFNRQAAFDDYDYYPVGSQFERIDREEGTDYPKGFSDSVKFKDIQKILKDLKAGCNAREIFVFLEKCKDKILHLIKGNRNNFSDKILIHIAEVLQLDLW
jgi:Zn-dependent peptidase ImmA (M78 family)